VDDTVHEEDFQDVHDEDNHVPQYLSYHGNVYDRTEHYPMSPSFRTSEWDDERELRTWTFGDDMNIRRGGGGNSSREMNKDNQDIKAPIAGRAAHLRGVLCMHGIHGHFMIICRNLLSLKTYPSC
jgi:hypothetical protein